MMKVLAADGGDLGGALCSVLFALDVSIDMDDVEAIVNQDWATGHLVEL